ncbi:hypothetical protein Q1695_004441 [Nippostrongylus brasiliensis]|nr:hypothetical protein Q1695_004441 [Nippostrongylus brasiliensis]
MAECMRGRFSAAGLGIEPSHGIRALSGSSRIHSVGNVANTHVAKPVKEQEEDVMHDYIENPSEALIESIGPRCLSFEDQENCYVEPEETGKVITVMWSSTDYRFDLYPPEERVVNNKIQ